MFPNWEESEGRPRKVGTLVEFVYQGKRQCGSLNDYFFPRFDINAVMDAKFRQFFDSLVDHSWLTTGNWITNA